MNRFHVNLSVHDLAASVRFYSALFDTAPTVERPDYAKWVLEDPQINFSLSTHGSVVGIDHIGIEASDDPGFAALRERLARAGGAIVDQPDVTCCYARSTKAWTEDPDGVAWETFVSRGASTVYGDGTETRAVRVASHPQDSAAMPDGTAP